MMPTAKAPSHSFSLLIIGAIMDSIAHPLCLSACWLSAQTLLHLLSTFNLAFLPLLLFLAAANSFSL
jgi:hypothetical protein